MAETENAGIDYGLRQTNIDQSTGIRYGVLPATHLGEFWYEGSEPQYSNPCPHCGEELPEDFDPESERTYPCCGEDVQQGDDDFAEPDSFVLKDASYTAIQGRDDVDVFILKAPYYTYAQFCSPCSPGACYLLNFLSDPIENNCAYCFGHECFEEGVAPYPVYSVETGDVVTPR